MKTNYNQQPVMRIETPAGATMSTETTDGFYKLRKWQQTCFAKLRYCRNWIITAPPAAGKSFEICAIAADRLKRDDDLKVIIAVPQTIIAAGFRANKIVLSDGSKIEWVVQPGHDLCREAPQQSAAHLLGFLCDWKSGDMMSRVIVCTHATLVRAFAKDKTAFTNILLVIDEAHHSRHGEYEGPDVEVDNQLGALVKHSLLNPGQIQVGLSTATFFRGDQATIVPDISQFARFEFAYDEYLATCKYLRSFSYDFLTRFHSFIDPLMHLFAKTIGKTIVYIPPVGASCSLGTKAEDVNAVLKAIAGTEEYIVVDEDQPIMRVKKRNEWIKVVNLVDERFREEKKEAIIAAHDNSDPDDIDVIIALGMFKEGANWRWADREIIIGQRSSLTELSQMIGRLFRDAPGKRHVEVYQLLPFVFDQTDRGQMRRGLNDYFIAIMLSLLFEITMSPPSRSMGGGKPAPGEGEERINYLRETCGDDNAAAMILEQIRKRVFDAFADGGSIVGGHSRRDTFGVIVADVLTSHGFHSYKDELADQLYHLFKRRTAMLKGLNIGNVDIDLVEENPFGFYLQYASEACGVSTFQELRTASQARAFMPFADARAFVSALRLKTVLEWYDYCASGQKPHDIPSNPQVAYEGTGWAGHTDWLGTGRTVPIYLPFHEAREFARGLRLKSQAQWGEFCGSGDKPDDIPSKPDYTYRDDGWKGLGDWLGTEAIATFHREYRPFAEARAFVHGLQLTRQKDWENYRKSSEKPADIPTNPNVVYKDEGWKDFGDWLGTGRVANRYRQYRPFQEARRFVHCLKLSSHAEWLEYCASGLKPADIPQKPARVYKGSGWISSGDWLGTGRIANRYRAHRPFAEARRFVHTLRLPNCSAWFSYCKSGKKPVDIPYDAATFYKDKGWAGYGDWLGTDHEAICKPADGPEVLPQLEWGTNWATLHEWANVKSVTPPPDSGMN